MVEPQPSKLVVRVRFPSPAPFIEIMSENQKTISNQISCSGVGIHSGKEVEMTLRPAEADSGIVFVRTDINDSKKAKVKADFRNVTQTNLGTTIENEFGTKICTIEHFLAGVWGAKIDNLIVELNSEEIPIMDGSSEPFIFLIECAGVKSLEAKKKYLKIKKKIEFKDGDKYVKASPGNSFAVDLKIDFNDKVIGKQSYDFDDAKSTFKSDVSRARTFGFKHEIDHLHKIGLAKGGSLKNAILVDEKGVVNEEGLRYDDEFARHKLLDFVGDVFLAGYHIKARFDLFKPGHDINNKFLHHLFDDESNYEIA